MTRCPECKKRVWPWQKQYLVTPPYHAACDIKIFKASLDELHRTNPNRFSENWMKDQIQKRDKHYY